MKKIDKSADWDCEYHYYYDGRRFVFGTEIKQVLQHPDVPRRLNELMVGLYLCGNFGDSEMTFYQDIKRLPGGCSLLISRDGLTIRRFWDPDPYDVIKYPSGQDYAERFRELFLDAVRCRLRSSTPVEVFLSGGVDSGSVASAAGCLKQRNHDTLPQVTASSWVYSHLDGTDESPYVRLIADRYDIPVTWLEADEFWALKSTPWDDFEDEPFTLPFKAKHCAGLEAVKRKGMRVVLTGEGGDETSMPGFMLHIRDWQRHLRWWSIYQDIRNATPGYRNAVLTVLRRSLVPRWLRHVAGRPGVSIAAWIAPDFANECKLASWLQRLEPRCPREGLYLQQRGRHPVFIMGDILCSRYSVEWRHPFYDSRIVEFLVRIPPGIRFRGGRSKVLLRQAMSGILPDEVRIRAPYGAFGPLYETGLKTMEKERLLGLLKAARLHELGIVDVGKLQETYETYLRGNDAILGRAYWTFVTEDWLRRSWDRFAIAERQNLPVRLPALIAEGE